jgi:hypothetical protein
VTQTGVIPAQRNRAPPCQIVANAALLEPFRIGLKVLTHPLKDLLGPVRDLKKSGWFLDRQKGSPRVFKHPKLGEHVSLSGADG